MATDDRRNDDLLKWTTSDVDFYEHLGVTFESWSESEHRRAYRKTALKYHPDKAGKAFDPEKWERVEAANGVLGNPELKAKYDGHRSAKLAKQRAKKRAARPSMMAEEVKVEASPVVSSPSAAPPAASGPISLDAEEDEVERLERLIREKERAKAQRRAEKDARKGSRKSGIFTAGDTPRPGGEGKATEGDTSTPIKRPDILRGLKADDKSSASPRFSFSPSTPNKRDFSATMARLRAAEEERKRMEEEIRQQDSTTAA